MAVERLFLAIKQDIMIKASDLMEQSSRLLRDGNREEGEVKLNEAKEEIEKTKRVDQILPEILEVLRAAGISQPPVEFLEQLISVRLAEEREPSQLVLEEGPEEKPVGEVKIVEPFTLPDDQELEDLKPTERRLLELTPFPEEEAILRSHLADLLFPDQRALADKKNQLSLILTTVKPKLAKKSWEIINPISRSEIQRGTEARYFLRPMTSPVRIPSEPAAPIIAEPQEGVTLGPVSEEEKPIHITTIPEEKSIIVEGRKISFTNREWPFIAYLLRVEQATLEQLSENVLGEKGKERYIQIAVIFNLRKKLGDSGRNPRFLKLINIDGQVGYMLDITPVAAPPTPEETEEVAPLASQAAVVEIEEEVEEPETNQLTTAEVYLLAKAISSKSKDDLEKVGIGLHPDDLQSISEIAQKIAANQSVTVDADQQRVRLTKKLIAFIQDQSTVFMANENDDSQFLLAAISALDSEEDIKQLLNS